MKAELSRDGTLTVSPENALEAYALDMWHVTFCGETDAATLKIETDEGAYALPKIADLSK